MTREEILAMDAGKELDELVADKVFGYKEIAVDSMLGKIFTYKLGEEFPADNYSTNVASAWEVIEIFESLSVHKGVLLNSIGKQLEGKGVWDKGYKCEIVVDIPNFKTVCAVGKSAPEAICKAALLATLESP